MIFLIRDLFLQRFRAARQPTIRLQRWRISCGTCTEPWPTMPSGSTPAKSSSRTPRWPSNAASWTASSNWLSTPTRTETYSETSEEPQKSDYLHAFNFVFWHCVLSRFYRILRQGIIWLIAFWLVDVWSGHQIYPKFVKFPAWDTALASLNVPFVNMTSFLFKAFSRAHSTSV